MYFGFLTAVSRQELLNISQVPAASIQTTCGSLTHQHTTSCDHSDEINGLYCFCFLVEQRKATARIFAAAHCASHARTCDTVQWCMPTYEVRESFKMLLVCPRMFRTHVTAAKHARAYSKETARSPLLLRPYWTCARR
jgi:hypothetical protein